MKKTNPILLAVLLCLALTACGNTVSPETAEDTSAAVSEAVSSSETESSSQAAEAETITETSAEEMTEETASESETTAEETTTVSETTVEAAETDEDGKVISPSGWLLDRTNDIAAEGHRDIEPDMPFFICELSNGDRIYGVSTAEEGVDEYGNDLTAEYTMIEHDGIVDEFRRDCFGRFGAESPLECELSDLDSDGDEEIFTTLYTFGGTYCLVMDMAVFDKNENGHYEMITISEPMTEFSSVEEALADEIISKIHTELDKENLTIKFSTDTSEYTAPLDETLFGEYTSEQLEESLFFPESIKSYNVKNNNIYMELDLAVSHESLIFPFGFCKAEGQLFYSDGKFTVGDVNFLEYEY